MIISLLNHKGGSGKTTAAVNIGAALSLSGKRVLLVDLDAQANATIALGVRLPDANVYGAIRGAYSLKSTVVRITDRLHLVPSVLDLGAAELELVNESGREMIVRELLTPIVSDYDFILIDCSPNLGILTLNSLVAASYVLIPMVGEFFAGTGLTRLIDVVGKIQKRLNPSLDIAGVFFSRFDNRKVLSRSVLDQIEKLLPGKVFNSKVRECVALPESQARGLAVMEYAPKSKAAADYAALAKELILRLKKHG
jgi:chromosome partitioning protein